MRLVRTPAIPTPVATNSAISSQRPLWPDPLPGPPPVFGRSPTPPVVSLVAVLVATSVGVSAAAVSVTAATAVRVTPTSLVDGHLIHGPATAPITSYEVRVKNGRVEVRAE